jgi:hypothetical protein
MQLTAQYFTITPENSTLEHSHTTQQILAKESHFILFYFNYPLFQNTYTPLFILTIHFRYSQRGERIIRFFFLVYLRIVKLHR